MTFCVNEMDIWMQRGDVMRQFKARSISSSPPWSIVVKRKWQFEATWSDCRGKMFDRWGKMNWSLRQNDWLLRQWMRDWLIFRGTVVLLGSTQHQGLADQMWGGDLSTWRRPRWEWGRFEAQTGKNWRIKLIEVDGLAADLTTMDFEVICYDLNEEDGSLIERHW